MSSSKIDRAQHGPSWAEVLFGAALSVLLGALLCAAWLVFKPVTTVRELPKQPVPGMVYFIPGNTSEEQGRTWLRKRQAFLDGQSIELTEEELNTAVVTPVERPKEEGSKSGAGGSELTAGAINFRIDQGRLQVELPVKVGLIDQTLIVQASGGFSRSGGRIRFDPSEIYVGSCPVGRIPVVRSLVLKRMYATQSVPEELVAAWDRLSDVTVEGRILKLVMAP